MIIPSQLAQVPRIAALVEPIINRRKWPAGGADVHKLITVC
jgi:hypothetical protein